MSLNASSTYREILPGGAFFDVINVVGLAVEASFGSDDGDRGSREGNDG